MSECNLKRMHAQLGSLDQIDGPAIHVSPLLTMKDVRGFGPRGVQPHKLSWQPQCI
jgi:hypothetical protein